MDHAVVAAGCLRVLREHLDREFPPLPPGNARDPGPLVLLYERWVVKEHWNLAREVLPLLLGCDPDIWLTRCADLELLAEAEESAQALADVASSGMGLPILNPEAPEHEWRVRPADVYLWAIGVGYQVPEPFATLVQYVLQVVKRPGFASSSPVTGAAAGVARERVLGAALALLARTPQACRDDNGFIDPGLMARCIVEQSVRWFESTQPPMTEAEIATLIAQWVD
ncbi:MAG TPA: hypothetical protein DCY89_01640 [Gammaproteobacteria bacterium]|nr:hypothetical protein [Gammaproteobacteria bacterium]